MSGAPIDPDWPELERFIQYVIGRHSGDQKFVRDDLAALLATEPTLLALDGLDEVANLDHRDIVANEIERAAARLAANAYDGPPERLRPTEFGAGRGFRRASGRTLVADIVTGSELLRTRPEPDADATIQAAAVGELAERNRWFDPPDDY